jgi:hypothetical protein
MKKIFALVLLIVVVLMTGCGKNKIEDVTIENVPSMFIRVEKGYSWSVYYHRDTKVMYAVTRGGYINGYFTLLVDVDGSPLLYEEA